MCCHGGKDAATGCEQEQTSGRAYLEARLRDLQLRHLRLRHALPDGDGRGLAFAERVDEHLVVQDVALALAQHLQDLGLERGQLLLVVGHLQQQLHLLLLDVGALGLDHVAQQLRLEAEHRYGWSEMAWRCTALTTISQRPALRMRA